VEVLQAVNDLFIKISVNCVLNYVLHYYLCVSFLCVFLVHVACVFLLLFCMNQCVCRVFVCFNLVSKFEFLVGMAQFVFWDATTTNQCMKQMINI
jgi:hypothetical protein